MYFFICRYPFNPNTFLSASYSFKLHETFQGLLISFCIYVNAEYCHAPYLLFWVQTDLHTESNLTGWHTKLQTAWMYSRSEREREGIHFPSLLKNTDCLNSAQRSNTSRQGRREAGRLQLERTAVEGQGNKYLMGLFVFVLSFADGW